jgi:hypothetical protein
MASARGRRERRAAPVSFVCAAQRCEEPRPSAPRLGTWACRAARALVLLPSRAEGTTSMGHPAHIGLEGRQGGLAPLPPFRRCIPRQRARGGALVRPSIFFVIPACIYARSPAHWAAPTRPSIALSSPVHHAFLQTAYDRPRASAGGARACRRRPCGNNANARMGPWPQNATDTMPAIDLIQASCLVLWRPSDRGAPSPLVD